MDEHQVGATGPSDRALGPSDRATGPSDPALGPSDPAVGPVDPSVDELPADPTAAAALVAEQRARTRAELGVDERLMFGAWGAAWLLGLGLMWASYTDRVAVPFGGAGAIFAVLAIAAAVLTTVHSVRRSAGVSGLSARQGAMYGWTWFAVFAGDGALMAALGAADASPDVSLLVGSAVPALLVAALYMVGGAMWADRAQYALGAWIAGSTVVGALVGSPGILLVMALAGGGGMLVAAALAAARRASARRRSGVARPGR